MNQSVVSHFKQLASGIYLEGLAVDHRDGLVWYSDVLGGGVHCYPNREAREPLNASRRWTGGVLMNADGSVLSSGEGGIRWNHPGTGASGWLINQLQGEPVIGINEMYPDGEGGLFLAAATSKM